MLNCFRVIPRVAGCAVALLVLAASVHVPLSGARAASKAEMIREALSAAAPAIRGGAKVMDWKGNVLRKGSAKSAYVCYPRRPGSKAVDAMCVDKAWAGMLQAFVGKKPYTATRLGISYMLAGDGGASNIDPYAKGPTATNQWVIEGPHLMIIAPGKNALEGIPTDPRNGGPYVMWKGTPYAHIMVPLK